VKNSITWSLALKTILVLVVAVSASSITFTSTNYQSEVGGVLKVANGVTLTDKGFATAALPVSATGTCPSAGNVTFTATPGTANTAIASGDQVYDAQVATTTSTPSVSCFTVTLTITPNGGSPNTYTVKIASGSSITAGQTIDCKFDVGSTLPSPPYTFLAKVQ
jgi:hypothetical protein